MPAIPTSPDRTFSSAVRINGETSESLYKCIQSITVEEDVVMGSSFAIQLNACRNEDGSWPYLEDENLQPWNRVTIYASFPKQTEVVMDGYISQLEIGNNPDGASIAVELRGVDATYEMNLEDKRRIWFEKTYEDIAREIIESYHLKPVIAEPSADNSKAPPHAVAQRTSDCRFLRELARRKGYEFFVHGGNAYFRPPELTGEPQKLIAVNFGEESNCAQIRIEADGAAPTEATVTFMDPLTGEVSTVSATTSGLPALGTKELTGIRGAAGVPQTKQVARRLGCLTLEQANDYATGLLRRSGWWIVASGTINGLRYGQVLRSRKLVTVKGMGNNYNGVYYVRRVRHVLTSRTYQMEFELVRNALGQVGTENFEGERPDSILSPPALGPGADPDPVRVAESGARVMPA